MAKWDRYLEAGKRDLPVRVFVSLTQFRPFFPDLSEERGLLLYGVGPYTMNQFGKDSPIRFSFYGEDVRAGKYILLVETGGGRCAGLSVCDEGVCTWYDSEWDFAMSCPVAIIPRPESPNLSLLTCTEKGAPAAHSYRTPHTPI